MIYTLFHYGEPYGSADGLEAAKALALEHIAPCEGVEAVQWFDVERGGYVCSALHQWLSHPIWPAEALDGLSYWGPATVTVEDWSTPEVFIRLVTEEWLRWPDPPLREWSGLFKGSPVPDHYPMGLAVIALPNGRTGTAAIKEISWDGETYEAAVGGFGPAPYGPDLESVAPKDGET